MENIQALTPEGITEFLSGNPPIEFTGQSRTERYAWIETTLSDRRYFSLSKKQRGAGPVRYRVVPNVTQPTTNPFYGKEGPLMRCWKASKE